MKEPEYVLPAFLAIERAGAVEIDAPRLAAAMIDASREPDPTATSADERPALLDLWLQGAGGWTSQ